MDLIQAGIRFDLSPEQHIHSREELYTYLRSFKTAVDNEVKKLSYKTAVDNEVEKLSLKGIIAIVKRAISSTFCLTKNVIMHSADHCLYDYATNDLGKYAIGTDAETMSLFGLYRSIKHCTILGDRWLDPWLDTGRDQVSDKCRYYDLDHGKIVVTNIIKEVYVVLVILILIVSWLEGQNF